MATDLEITLSREVEPRTDVLHLAGRATYERASRLRRELFGAIAGRPDGRLVLELAAVEKMDTAAMAVLVEGLLATRRQGPHLSFCTPSESVRQVFELSGLDEALDRCYGCLGDALGDRAVACGCD